MGDSRTAITTDAKSEKNWRKLEYTGPPRALAVFDLEEIQSDVYGTFHFKGTHRCTLPYDEFPQPNLDDIEAMELFVHNWLVKYGITGPDEKEFVKFKQPYTLCGAFTNPQDPVSSEINKLYYIILAWLWRLDDDNYEKRIKTEEDYLAYVKRGHIMRETTVRILKGEIQNIRQVPPNPKFDRYEQRCLALFDIYEMLCRLIKDYHKNYYYFIKSVDCYFRGAITIHEERADFSEYSWKFLRQCDGGTQMTAEIIAMLRHVVVPKEIRQNLLFKRFKMCYLSHITHTNDLLGLRTDLKKNDYCNIITFKANRNGDIMKSCAEILRDINEKTEETIATAELLRRSFPNNLQLLDYVKIIELFVDGHAYWYGYAPRYGTQKISV